MHRSHHRKRKTLGQYALLLMVFAQVWAQTPNPKQAVSLSLTDAVELALKNSLQSVIASEQIVQAKEEKRILLSALLPNISATASQMNLTSNLAALGLPMDAMPGLSPFVEPFNRFDARFQIAQNVFNLASIRRFQAGSHGLELARQRQRLAVQQVVAATAISYLSALTAEQGFVLPSPTSSWQLRSFR
jgi:outer membrane protein TolC